jgi:hypothetical protein
VTDRLEVDLVEGDAFVRKQVECPASVSFWRFATGELDEVCFSGTIHFEFRYPVGGFAVDGIEPAFAVAFADIVDGTDAAADVLTIL